MIRKRTITAVIIVTIALIVAGVGAFVVAVHPSEDATYTEAASSVRAAPHTNATNGQVELRVNNVSDASDPATAAVWASLSPQARQAGVIYRALTPSPGEKNLVANITVTNVRPAAMPFTYTDFLIVGRDGSAYYANYALCNSSCSAAALRNQTLPESFTSDLFVLFSVPTTADAAKLVYASSPPIVMNLA
ncbi:MAG: hypothetical protein ABSB81_01400 [Halobacteriota archaeon]